MERTVIERKYSRIAEVYHPKAASAPPGKLWGVALGLLEGKRAAYNTCWGGSFIDTLAIQGYILIIRRPVTCAGQHAMGGQGHCAVRDVQPPRIVGRSQGCTASEDSRAQCEAGGIIH